MRIKYTQTLKKIGAGLEKFRPEEFQEKFQEILDSDDKRVRGIILFLGLLSLPLLLGVAATVPNLFGAMGRYNRSGRYHNQYKSFRRLVHYAQKKNYIKVHKVKNEEVVELQKEGRKLMYYYLLQNLRVVPVKKWDKKWRLVIFDISNDKNTLRDFLRRKLKDLRFKQIQKSVFLSPWPCKRGIDFLKQALRLRVQIVYMEVNYIENEEELKKLFRIR